MEKEKSNSPDSADVSSKKKKNKNVTTEEDTNYKSGQLIDMAKVMPRKQGYSTRHLQMTNLSLRALIYVCINLEENLYDKKKKKEKKKKLHELERLEMSDLFKVTRRRSVSHKDPFFELMYTDGIEAKIMTLRHDGSSIHEKQEYFLTPDIFSPSDVDMEVDDDDVIISSDNVVGGIVKKQLSSSAVGAKTKGTKKDPKEIVKQRKKQHDLDKAEHIRKGRAAVKGIDFDRVYSCDPNLRALYIAETENKAEPNKFSDNQEYHRQRREARSANRPPPKPPPSSIYTKYHVNGINSYTGRTRAQGLANGRWFDQNDDDEDDLDQMKFFKNGNPNDDDDDEKFIGGIPISFEDACASLEYFIQHFGNGMVLENSKRRKRERMHLAMRQKIDAGDLIAARSTSSTSVV
mmetsp:Transcript_1956/g.2608  ORF Transcript_1956/g.2608 Transcript_1956/m.2608 type:complete len:405 (+) Transcript_1956:854-2068(+)